MMFAVRGLAVSLSIFAMLYVALSAAVGAAWRRIWTYGQRHSACHCTDMLFALRIIPFVVSAALTLVLTVPSFLLLEPRAVNEPLGLPVVILGCCGLAVIIAGAWNAAAAWLRASQTVARWSNGASSLESSIGSREIVSTSVESRNVVSVLQSATATSPLTAAGILRPSVWLSRAAQFVLSERELRAALQHEFVHVRRRDNLRKLILRLVAFPGMAELESAWRHATEMAADDAAVSNASEALDLAAAVIKLSRLIPLEAPPELMTALVQTPLESVNARVERLIAWTERRQTPARNYSWRYALCGAIAIGALAMTYSGLLIRMHAATEWLVR